MSTDNQNRQAPAAQPQEFSLERIRGLVAALERELQNAPPDLPNAQSLRQEIETLKQALASAENQQVLVKERLHSVRSTLQDMTARVENEVLQDSRYVAEIGRILGLV